MKRERGIRPKSSREPFPYFFGRENEERNICESKKLEASKNAIFRSRVFPVYDDITQLCRLRWLIFQPILIVRLQASLVFHILRSRYTSANLPLYRLFSRCENIIASLEPVRSTPCNTWFFLASTFFLSNL